MTKQASLVWMAIAACAIVAHPQTSTGASEYGNATAQAGQASASGVQATGVSAELSKKLDSKDAKVGDEVVAKTTAEAHFADGTKIPKGSRLVGHVTEVQAKSHDNHDSHLAFAFDHAVLKDGREVPIHAWMRSLSAPAPMASTSGSDDLMAGSGMQGGGGGGSRGGGGLVGGGGGVGMANNASGTVRGATGIATNTSSATAGGLNNATSGLDAAASSTVGATGNLGASPAAGAGGGLVAGTVMPVGNLSGVTFATVNAAGGASGSGVTGSAGASIATMLTGHGKNVSLDGGSQMTLAVAPQ